MKSKSVSSKTFSEKRPEASMKGLSIYDVPGVVLEAREAAYLLLEPNPDTATLAKEIIEKLNLAMRAMGSDDIGLVLKTS
jgi:hypothetical protein